MGYILVNGQPDTFIKTNFTVLKANFRVSGRYTKKQAGIYTYANFAPK